MAERMTRYQLAFAPFLNKYINDELSKHYGGRRVTGVLPGLQNQCGAWYVPGGFDSHMFPPVNHIYFTAFQLSNAACQDSFLSIPAGKMLFVVAFQKSNGTLS